MTSEEIISIKGYGRKLNMLLINRMAVDIQNVVKKII